jgi:ABC-type transporter MlaC component
MTKKILVMLLLLAAGFYAMTAKAKGDRVAVDPTNTAQVLPTATAKPDTCKVYTGVDGGTVNLRECEGAACGAVLDVLTEGESLIIITAGEWMNVTNKDGVTGWLNKKYCKGK